MKVIFMVYHDILEDRINVIQKEIGIDYFTQWEGVKGKGHETDAHMGTRTFPGFNCVRMIAFQEDACLNKLIEKIELLNKDIVRQDDKIRIFQMPLDRVL